MGMKDISEYKIGEIATTSYGVPYRVEKFNFTKDRKGRTVVQSSTCTNLETGSETIITWSKTKNKMFH